MPDKTYAKFILNNETYLDLTGDTVDSSSLLAGYTAHDRSGALITGSFDTSIFVLKAGDTMTGPLILSGAPTENLHAATKKYVDDSVANYLPLTGGIMGKSVDDPEDENHGYIYTNTIQPDYITLNKDEYYNHALVGNFYSSISPESIILSKLYTDTNTEYVMSSILKDSELSFETGPYGGSRTKYASYKSNGISYTTYDYVFPSKSGTFALTNDLLSYIPKTGGTITGGYLIIDDTHLTSGSSSAYLTLGNNIDSSSEGSSFGVLHLYGTGVYKSSIRTTTLTDNRQLYLPDKDGTLAVTSDLDSYVLKTGDSLTGALSFYDGSTLKSKISNTELQINGHDLLRMTPHFAQMFATKIVVNANLNSETYLKCSQYYCDSGNTVASLSNCPATAAFTMNVEAPIQTTYDDESSTTASYRLRTIKTYIGEVFIQYVTRSNGGSYYYYPWQPVSIGVSKDTYSNASMKTGELIARRNGNVVNIVSSGNAISVASGNWRNYVTIAEKYRPSEEIYAIVTNAYGEVKTARIRTNGMVDLYTGTSITSASNFAFTATYIVD